MTKGIYTRSVAKYIRRQKALIRRATSEKEEQDRLIREVLARCTPRKKRDRK